MARYYQRYPQYVPVAVYRERNKKAVEKLRKTADIQPVEIPGREIAKTWWGQHWCRNLERYADFHNRIERGRKYVRHGAVVDLRIENGIISGLVKGSDPAPYTLEITVKKLSDKKWEKLCQKSLSSVESLSELLNGKFPEDLKDLFFAKKEGIYPAPKEISFTCSCPDWASMCKHIAAMLYGVGNRLDTRPELLFTLRGVTVEELVDKTLSDSTDKLIRRAEGAAAENVIADADLEDVFGIEMDDSVSQPIDLPDVDDFEETQRKEQPIKKKKNSSTSPKNKGKKMKRTKRKQKKKTARPGVAKGSILEYFLQNIEHLEEDFRTGDLEPLFPDWPTNRITNTLHRAYRKGRLERVSSGLYRYNKK